MTTIRSLPSLLCGGILTLTPIPAIAVHNLLEVDVEVDAEEPSLAFSWFLNHREPESVEISRRPQGEVGASTWELKGTFDSTTTTWSDAAVEAGEIYEYKFFLPAANGEAETAAYLSCGIEAPLVDDRGRILLIVEEGLATELAAELGRFEMDLVGDGWTVERLDSPRDGEGEASALRAAIQSRQDEAPLSSLLLLGNLPVETSGLIAPDQHEPYEQATDLYYADLDGQWQDVRSTSGSGRNYYPGDGHLDEVIVPGPNHRIELPVGRVDFSGMPAWPLDEVALMRRYLTKNHNFRHLHHAVPRRGYYTSMAFDDSPVEAAAVVAMLGRENCVEAYDDQTEQSQPFLWGIAGRDWNGENYPSYRFKSHFTVNFASGKQAWSWENNQMRAMLAMPWYGLTCGWGVRPNWFFHHMGMGAPIGESFLRTVNNNDNGTASPGFDYLPVDDFDGWLDGYVHINLMGDPTLRLHPIAPASDLAAAPDEDGVSLQWEASPDGEVIGYHIYSSPERLGPYVRLTDSPQAETVFRDEPADAETTYYMVRPVKLEASHTGTYYNAGQGVFARVEAGAANVRPQAGDEVLTVDAGGMATLTLPMPEGGMASLEHPPSHGEIVESEGILTYYPDEGFEGEERLGFSVWDGLAKSSGTLTLQVGETPFSIWQSTIDWQDRDSSPFADPNGNGLVNLLEFHLGRDPLATDAPLFSRRAFTGEEGGSEFVLEFRRRQNSPSLVIEIAEGDLADWQTLDPSDPDFSEEVIGPDPAGDGSVEDVRLTIHRTSQKPSCYLRFRVGGD
ncbi:MAG: C25 family cysteine peptidase [Verrucomicrobiota bacterium JB023]|nr:C25 family cysteine peptidase [Verrucomicrobiota bacterium JB023]